jgi:prepilin peptidase CpaA
MTDDAMFGILAGVLVCIACFTDLRTRRIPNWLTLPGVCAGLLVHAIASGVQGIGFSLAGMMLGFGAYFVLYCLRAMGAGDVKLMSALGAILGPAACISVFAATAIAGGVLALGLVIFKRRVKETLWNTFYIASELLHFRAPYKTRSDLDVKDRRSLKMPHGVAIAVGTAIVLLTDIL